MDDGPLLLLVLGVAAGGAICWRMWRASAPHTVLRIHGGRIELEHGALPHPLVEALRDFAGLHPELDGWLDVSGSGQRTTIAARQIGERYEQRLMNTIAPYRDQVRRPR